MSKSSQTPDRNSAEVTLKSDFMAYWRASRLHRANIIVIAIIAVSLLGMYGVARWYMLSERSKPLTLGVSFVPDYAQHLGVDPHANFTALLDDMKVRNFRLVSYWSDIEKTPGQYDFSELDWEFTQADKAHAHIMLAVGLRQPRWPECHAPSWIDTSKPTDQWYPQLKQFMTTVVNRYKGNPALSSYQAENEYFLTAFGQCTNYDRSRLIDEYNLVKRLDPHHPAIVTRSQNDLGTPLGQPRPDEYGVSVYKRVWDSFLTHRYVEYPFPAWYYAFEAGIQKITTGKDMIIHEMQAEPWAPNGQDLTQTSLTEQNKSLTAQRLQGRFDYAKGTGIKTIYMWGAEYWYYRSQVLHDTSVWNTAKANF